MTINLPKRPVVLVIEDEFLIRINALDIAAEAGFEALEAVNAVGAIDILENRADVQVVFTDINLPGNMNGLQLAHAVRQRWPPIGIIVTSGYTIADESQLPSASVFLRKPYQPSQIARALRALAA